MDVTADHPTERDNDRPAMGQPQYSGAEDEGGSSQQPEALRYLEEYASSVAEEMKKQTSHQELEGSSMTAKELEDPRNDEEAEIHPPSSGETDHPLPGPIVNTEPVNAVEVVTGDIIMDADPIPNSSERTSDLDQASQDGSETDEAENPEEDLPMEDENSVGSVVTLVVELTPSQAGSKTGEGTPPANKLDDSNTLRRSQRKRQVKKRVYEGDSSDDYRGVKLKVEARQGKCDKSDPEADSQEGDQEDLTQRISKYRIQYVCEICEREYPTQMQYKTHLRTHSDQRPHQCVYCPKQFRQKCQKDKHERTHTGCKPYKCRYCERAFSESGSRNRHERIHSGHKPYACQHCDRRFIQKGNKDAHEKTHRTYKPFKCFNDNCTETFASAEELEEHRNGHPQRPYKCHFCCSAFPFNAERKRHERRHTGVRPYKCSYCEKTFTQKGNKDNHERTHTGDKPHACRFCDKRFIRKQYLGRHISMHHSEQLIQEQYEEAAEALSQPTVYAVLEVGPELESGDRLAAENLLRAASMVANSSEKNGQAVEQHVAILEQGPVPHQLQVVDATTDVSQTQTNIPDSESALVGNTHDQIGRVMEELNQQLCKAQAANIQQDVVQQELLVGNSSTPCEESNFIRNSSQEPSQKQLNGIHGGREIDESNQSVDFLEGPITSDHTRVQHQPQVMDSSAPGQQNVTDGEKDKSCQAADRFLSTKGPVISPVEQHHQQGGETSSMVGQEDLGERTDGNMQNILVIHDGGLAVHHGKAVVNIGMEVAEEGHLGSCDDQREQEGTVADDNNCDGDKDGQSDIRIHFEEQGDQLFVDGHEIIVQATQVSE